MLASLGPKLVRLQRGVYATQQTKDAIHARHRIRQEVSKRIGPLGAGKLIKLSQRKVKRHKRKRNTIHTHTRTHTQAATQTATRFAAWLGQPGSCARRPDVRTRSL